MEHRLAAAECDDRRSQGGQLVDPREHRLGRYRLGHLVVLVAVAAVDVAAADGHEMDEQRMIGTCETAPELADGPQRSARLPESTHQTLKYIRSSVPTQPVVSSAAECGPRPGLVRPRATSHAFSAVGWSRDPPRPNRV